MSLSVNPEDYSMTGMAEHKPKSYISLPDAELVTKEIYDTMNSEKGASLADITLVTSDNVRIPALRTLLSLRSSYFEKLFFLDFAEKQLSEISLSIESKLLREILEFIYTDDCNLIRIVRKKMQVSATVECTDVQALVTLADAADCTNVELLVARCEEAVKSIMGKSPHIACTTVRALAHGRKSWGKGLLDHAVNTVAGNMIYALLVVYGGCDAKCGLMHLDERSALDVFAMLKPDEGSAKPEKEGIQQEEQMTQQQKNKHLKMLVKRDGLEGKFLGWLFQSLIVWASGGTALLSKEVRPSWGYFAIVIDTECINIMDKRLEAAKRIASWFDLSFFKPRFLSNVVEASGLVGKDLLFRAYKKQSIELEERCFRGGPWC